MKLTTKALLFLFVSYFSTTLAQSETSPSKLSFTGDFRFRIEQDWDSKKSDGTYRENRSRLRYRVRFGANYKVNSWGDFGVRIRTGYRNKQQDPHLTLGDNFNEFGTVPIGFEKLFFEYKQNGIRAWVGKNTFPFAKQNELFWSDNVYPEGMFFGKSFTINRSYLESIAINVGHFIVNSYGEDFGSNSYFQGIQLHSKHLNNRLDFYPTFYYFNKMPNIPDGNGTFNINYNILNLGSKFKALTKTDLVFGFDFYTNFSNYENVNEIQSKFQSQNKGYVASVQLGNSKHKGNWLLYFAYTYLEKFSAVDYLAQNDWARWDYSSQGSPDGRLTNFKGFELKASYNIAKQIKLSTRFFMVEQILSTGVAKENGNRIRFDLDIGF